MADEVSKAGAQRKDMDKIVPKVETPATEAKLLDMCDAAKAQYKEKEAILDGKINVSVNDKRNHTLDKMAWFYKQEEKMESLPKLLEDFKKDIQTKSIKDLWKIRFGLIDEKGKYIKLLKKRYEEKPLVFYKGLDIRGSIFNPYYEDLAPYLLNESEYAQFKHVVSKMDLVLDTIQTKRDCILQKYLRHSSDKAVNCKYIDDYVDSEKHLRAFEEYYDIYPYNSSLREGETLSKGAQATVKAMDEVFEIAPELKEEAVVYRALHGNPVFKKQNEFVESLKERMIITDKSYVSTSVDIENPQFAQFANGVIDENYGALMRIKLPKGTKGVLGGIKEYLLPRNSQIKINKIEMADGIKIMDCEYILP